MLAGMGIVYLFLGTLIVVTKVSMQAIGRLDGILPQEAPKKASRPVAADDDANIALAIAVAIG